MNPGQARNLVRETLTQSFDKARFRNFALEVLNEFDASKAFASNKTYIKDAFKDHVECFERLGTYTSPEDEKLDVLVVHLTRQSKLERARTAIRNFVADHLKQRDGKDAALVAFVSPTEKQWRFSYVKMEYGTLASESGKVGVETRLTPARRFSYIVGEGESCHTAQTRFIDLLRDTDQNPTLTQLEEAFSVEAVTKEFFRKYAELFEEFKAALNKLEKRDPTIRAEFAKMQVRTADFAKKLMGQIVFLYFIQKKGWLGVAKGNDWGTGPHDFLRKLARGEYGKFENFFNDILEPLFYDTLATDRGHEAWCKRFSCRIPFLNGGLFDPLADYDWRKTDIVLPNRLFTNNDRFDEFSTGTGLLDMFDRYNFTVNEAEPLEKEVAIDPEMLGKVFENLIEENLRKGLGSYYTPREIVHYMCQESLINYLDTLLNCGSETIGREKRQQAEFSDENAEQTLLAAPTRQELVPRADIETFVHLGDQISHYEAVETEYRIKMPKGITNHAKLIDEKLADITICDPAVGSGAFPVGMMTEIVRARAALTPYFNDVHDRTPYHFKRHAIQNCLYGVDIDPGAAEIAKLRLWLSLVVDEEDVKQIKPLPNLFYKIVTGNSLLDVQKTLFNEKLFRQLEELKPRYFDEPDKDKKDRYKEEIEHTIHELTNGKETFDFQIYFSEVFHRKGGFDVVIGNPPYLRIQGLAETQPELLPVYKRNFKSASGNFDLYGLFIERGYGLLRKTGNFAYIVPHKFFQASFGKRLRAILNEQRALTQVVRFGAEQVFDEPSTYTCLLFLSRLASDLFDLFDVTDLSNSARVFTQIRTRQPDVAYRHAQLPTPVTDDWDFHVGGGDRILTKLSEQTINLGDITRKIFVGLQTSSDRVFVLTLLRTKRHTLLCHSKALDREMEIERGLVKPFLLGRNVHRYQPPSVESVAIFPYSIKDGHADLMTSQFIRENFPLGWKYLSENKSVLQARERGRFADDWHCYGRTQNLCEFEAVKIMTPDICDGPQMTLDQTGDLYHTTTLYSFVFKNSVQDHPKFFLGVLNSRLLWYFMSVTGTVLRGGYLRFKTEYLRPFPVRCSLSKNPPTEAQQDEIVRLVDRILAAKQCDAGADTNALEREIDGLVYALYGLTPEEIKIVERASARPSK